MFSLQSIKDSLVNFEYGLNIQSLVVLTPLSILVQKVKENAEVRKLISNCAAYNAISVTETENKKQDMIKRLYVDCHKRIQVISRWHGVGAAIQGIFYAFLCTAHWLAIIPMSISFYQAAFMTGEGRSNVLFQEFGLGRLVRVKRST